LVTPVQFSAIATSNELDLTAPSKHHATKELRLLLQMRMAKLNIRKTLVFCKKIINAR
jgi:hypothetical protein